MPTLHKRDYNKIIALFFIVVTIFSCLESACMSADMDEIWQKNSLMPSQVRSYQFEAKIDFKEKDIQYPPVTFTGMFSQSEKNLRVESITLEPPGKTVDPIAKHTIYAYNGKEFQWFIVGRETISFSKQPRHPNLYWLPNPMMLPFSWIASSRTNWADLKDKKIWTKRFDNATYERSNVINGYTCEIICFPDEENQDGKLYVYFAKDLDYYPLRIKRVLGNSFTTVDVVNHTVLSSPEGDIVFPLAISIKEIEGVKEVSNMDLTVTETSIRINHQIDNDFFTISPALAKTVIDYDKELEKFSLNDGSIDLAFDNKYWDWKRITFLVTVNSVIIILLASIFFRRYRKNIK